MPTLTVFTPTFNRAYTLPQTYESLKKQTCKDFLWLIIDDGSSDRTESLVQSWIAEGLVDIRYRYQDNQGMHGAHNTAYELIDTELNVCIDSDDYMASDAVEKIVSFWRRHGSREYAGIIGLDATPDGAVLGTRLPEHVSAAKLTDLHGRYKVKGDKKLVYRTELTRSCPPYPIVPGEKYCPLSYKYVLIDQMHPLLLMNEVLCHVEYLADGSSMNMIHQYRRNPRGFLAFRKVAMQFAPTYKDKLRQSMHYVSSSLISGNRKFVSESPCKWTTLLAVPLGYLLYRYITRTSRATIIKPG